MSFRSRQVLRSSTNNHPDRNDQQLKSPARLQTSVSSSTASSVQDDAPSVPKPPRSAFMCFTDAKKKDIMDKRGIVEENDDILNIVAEEWKNLSDKDRAHWDEESRNDKVRYVRAKAAYRGPDLIPKRRAKKHPLAPKRPMSAFLKFSQTRRQKVKDENPDMSNTDVSRLLGEMWRNATSKEQAPYREQEEKERAIYKESIKKFKDQQARMDAAHRTSLPEIAPQRASYHHHPPFGGYYHHSAHNSTPPPAPGFPNAFDTLRLDSFEEPLPSQGPSKHAPSYFSHYKNQYPHYPRQTFASLSEHGGPSTHASQYLDDPIPVYDGARIALEEDDSVADHFHRSGYFSEGPSHYPRYS